MMSEASKYRIALALGFTGLLIVLLWQTTVLEDSYITFRVVDNFTHGFGLRWNVDERVQTYSNPLWMLLHIPFYLVWNNIFLITIILSISCVLSSLLLTIATFRRSYLQVLCLLIAPLVVSPSFLKFSTSGLENPLTDLLFAAFAWALFKAPEKKRWFYTTLFLSLSLVNRLDEFFFYIPITIYFLTQYRSINVKQSILGSLPILGWLSFSLFYYGFIFPNTKYAKLNSGLPESMYAIHGVGYAINFFLADFSSALWVIMAAFVIPCCWIFSPRVRSIVPKPMFFIALNILSYVVYTIYIGGDYMMGRFFTLPLFASVWLVYTIITPYITNRVAIAVSVIIVSLRCFYPDYGTIARLCPWCFHNVQQAGLSVALPLKSYLQGKLNLPEVNRTAKTSTYAEYAMIGMRCYKGGPNMRMADGQGIGDPLIARLPIGTHYINTIGHMDRTIPEGYLYAITTGSLEKMDPALAQYYQKLRFIISGDLWDTDRLYEIIRFNLGYYDYLRDEYIESQHLNML